MHAVDEQFTIIHWPRKKTVRLMMIIFFAFIIPLVLCFGCVAFILSQTNRTTPRLDKRFEIELNEHDELNDLLPQGNGFVYLVNGNEIRIVGEDGEALGEFRYKSNVTAIGNNEVVYDTKAELTVALEDQTIHLYQYNDGKYEETDSVSVPGIVTHMYCGYSDKCVYVLEDGRAFRMSLAHTDTDEYLVDRYLSSELIGDDLKLVSDYYGVGKDNSIIHLYDDAKITPIEEEIIGLNRDIAYTRNQAYTISFYSAQEDAYVTEIAVFEDGQFYACRDDYMYRKDGQFYYTGILSGEWRGKGIPESRDARLKLPESDRYFVIDRGVVCYRDHTIVCYWV